MTDAKLASIVCFCLLALIAGCTERGDQAASVVADVENTSVQGEQVRLTVNVTSDGGSHTVTAHDVVVTFNADNGSTIHTTEIGTMGEPHTSSTMSSVSTKPFRTHHVRFASVSVRSKSRILTDSMLRVQDDPVRIHYGMNRSPKTSTNKGDAERDCLRFTQL